MSPRRGPSEGWMVFLVGAVQFVNIWDFVMVMPLGPDFARALDIPLSRLGLLGGAYTAAAAVAGIVGSTFRQDVANISHRMRCFATIKLNNVRAPIVVEGNRLLGSPQVGIGDVEREGLDGGRGINAA